MRPRGEGEREREREGDDIKLVAVLDELDGGRPSAGGAHMLP